MPPKMRRKARMFADPCRNWLREWALHDSTQSKPSNDWHMVGETPAVSHRVVEDVGRDVQERQFVIGEVGEVAIKSSNAASLCVEAVAAGAVRLIHLRKVGKDVEQVVLRLAVIPAITRFI